MLDDTLTDFRAEPMLLPTSGRPLSDIGSDMWQVSAALPSGERTAIADLLGEDLAKRVALALNCHDELVAACEALFPLASARVYDAPPGREKGAADGVAILEAARVVIRKAKLQP